MLISIVIPCYNGSRTIGELVPQLVEKISSRYTLEVVIVNDGSVDDTEEVCISLHKKYPAVVRFFSLAKNFGEHNAVMAGLNFVRGDYVLIMDDDFQNPITEVEKLIEFSVKENHDVTYTYYLEKKHSVFRNLGSKLNDKMANIMLKKPKGLYLSSFKILNSFLVQEIISYRLPYPYIDGLILRTTRNIGQLQVDHHERRVGESSYTLRKLVSLWSNMFVNFSILPLRLMIVFGFLCMGIGFVFGVNVVFERMSNPDIPLGYSSLVVVVVFFSGIQILLAGFIGEYIGRMFLSQNKTPQYVVRKKFDSFSGDDSIWKKKNTIECSL